MMRSRLINGFGLVMTGSVLVIVLATKFTKGAWIVVVAMPLIFLLMRADPQALRAGQPRDHGAHVRRR